MMAQSAATLMRSTAIGLPAIVQPFETATCAAVM
jgi:hypothetical protein